MIPFSLLHFIKCHNDKSEIITACVFMAHITHFLILEWNKNVLAGGDNTDNLHLPCLALPSAQLHMQLELAGGEGECSVYIESEAVQFAVTVAHSSSPPLPLQSNMPGQPLYPVSSPAAVRPPPPPSPPAPPRPLGPPPVLLPDHSREGWSTIVLVGLSLGVGAAFVALVLLVVRVSE